MLMKNSQKRCFRINFLLRSLTRSNVSFVSGSAGVRTRNISNKMEKHRWISAIIALKKKKNSCRGAEITWSRWRVLIRIHPAGFFSRVSAYEKENSKIQWESKKKRNNCNKKGGEFGRLSAETVCQCQNKCRLFFFFAFWKCYLICIFLHYVEAIRDNYE